MSRGPDFLICIECENPCYVFEWNDHEDKLTEALCTVCGNDNPDLFQTEAEFEGDE